MGFTSLPLVLVDPSFARCGLLFVPARLSSLCCSVLRFLRFAVRTGWGSALPSVGGVGSRSLSRTRCVGPPLVVMPLRPFCNLGRPQFGAPLLKGPVLPPSPDICALSPLPVPQPLFFNPLFWFKTKYLNYFKIW